MTSRDGLKGKVAVVTGGGAGIGKAAAKHLAAAGARVGVLSRTAQEVRETCAEIEQAGGTALPLTADVSQVEPMVAAYELVQRTWGRLDIVFANAGINGVWTGLEELAPEEWDKTLAINLRGTFLTVKYAVPLLKKNGGAIVITSSVNGTRMFSNTGASAYATSKAGQVAFGRMCALELAAHRIRVNTICPGAIETHIDQNTDRRHLEHLRLPVEFPGGQVPLTQGKPGTANQVAELVTFLVSDAASHITGTEVFIDGAQSLLQG
jgi:NAD(P)-dependent dehydrogenase (short-subunit alcohol dehydrogenase family)